MRYSLRPTQRGFEPVVAPEQFAVRGRKARRAEHAEPLRLVGLRAQPRLARVRLRRCERTVRLGARSRQEVTDGVGIVDPATLAELGAEHRAAEVLARKIVAQSSLKPGERDAGGEQAVLRER